MTFFTDNDILRLDERYALADIPFHARPFRAAVDLLGDAYVEGVVGNPLVREIEQAYARLIPEVNFTWPGMGTGLVASLDRVRKVTIGVVFGTVDLTIAKGLGFSSDAEWKAWCRHDSRIIARSAFALADMHDLVYGIDNFKVPRGGNTASFWGLAAEQLRLVAESLSLSGAITSPVLQPICLAAELAMKGTLLHQGIAEKELRNPKLFGHDLAKLGERMCAESSHRDDLLLLNALSNFPDYVTNRYRETQLSRMAVISFALAAQFVAASAVRRISGEDLAIQMETTYPGPRTNFFP